MNRCSQVPRRHEADQNDAESEAANRADLHDIVAASDGRAAAVTTSHVTRGGETAEEGHVLLFTVVDDKITEIRTLVPDIDDVTRFWS